MKATVCAETKKDEIITAPRSLGNLNLQEDDAGCSGLPGSGNDLVLFSLGT